MFRNLVRKRIILQLNIFHYRNLSELPKARRINQFPYENVITVKDLLSIVSRRIGVGNTGYVQNDGLNDGSPKWLPITFNLKTEIPKFVSYYQHREKWLVNITLIYLE